MARKRCYALAILSLGLALALAVASPSRGAGRKRRIQRSQDDSFSAAVPQRVVQPGDTLWGLCDEVTGKPWIWPQIWAMNPEITNPHWLFPGDLIRFDPSAPGEAISRAELVASAVEVGIDNPTEAAVDRARTGPKVEVVGALPPHRRRAYHQHLFADIFLTPDEYQETGRLSNAMPDRILLVPGDTLYLRFNRKQLPKAGDKVMLFRTVRQVHHPLSGRSSGYITQLTGLATVRSVDNDVGMARLDKALREVERGQMVAPYATDLLLDVTEAKASKAVKGIVLATEADPVAVGEQKLVFIDRGAKDGLARGNTLQVHSRGDEMTGESRNMPPINIGTLLVVDAKASVSSCVVVDAEREIWPGDPVSIALPPPPGAAKP